MTEIRHVVPAPSGGWLVLEDTSGAPAPTTRNRNRMSFERKRDAEAHAKDIVRQHGGGEVMLHTPSGRIVEVDTVTPEEAATTAGG